MSAPTRAAVGSPLQPDRPSRGRRWAWLLVALATGLVVALATGAQLLGKLAQQSFSGSTVYRQPVSSLSVDADSGSVTVRPGPVGEVTVSQTLHWTSVRPTVRVDRDGGTLTVVVQCDGYGPLSDLGCEAELTILVPPQTALTSSSGAGDLTVQRLSGPLNLQSGSGGIELDEVSGAVQAVTGSGNIDAEGLRSARFQAQSGSGPVDLGFALPPRQVRVTTDSGPVDIDLPRGSSYRVGGSSDSGPRDVDSDLSDPSATGSITVNTTSGPVALDH